MLYCYHSLNAPGQRERSIPMIENEQKTCSMQPTSPLRYAVGMFGTSIPVNMFKTYAAFFYVDRLGLITTPQYSLILFLYTFLDAIDNPVYGFLSDHTRTKWGRRRPWLLIGAPLLVLCFILFFNPPAFLAPGSAFSYVLIMYMLTGTLDSLINVNYGALFPELFPTEASQARTNAMHQVFQFVAMIISIALTPVITDAIGFVTTAYIYGALAIVVIWFMALGCHENPRPWSSRSQSCSKPFWILLPIPSSGFTEPPMPLTTAAWRWSSPVSRSTPSIIWAWAAWAPPFCWVL